jgi:ABC-type multidrug transport system fused ATPase/permease subunit
VQRENKLTPSNKDILNSEMFTSDIPRGINPRECVLMRPHVAVLRGLDFEVKPGQYVALVGSSGCGKSTAVGLVERFYDPVVGQVLVDGMNVPGYNLSEYRKNISLVSQEPT